MGDDLVEERVGLVDDRGVGVKERGVDEGAYQRNDSGAIDGLEVEWEEGFCLGVSYVISARFSGPLVDACTYAVVPGPLAHSGSV